MDAWHYRLAAVWKYYDKDNVPLEWYLTVALLRVFACLILWISGRVQSLVALVIFQLIEVSIPGRDCRLDLAAAIRICSRSIVGRWPTGSARSRTSPSRRPSMRFHIVAVDKRIRGETKPCVTAMQSNSGRA
jgi:hypothetical protein